MSTNVKAGDRVTFNCNSWEVLEVMVNEWLKLRHVERGFNVQWIHISNISDNVSL